MPTLGQEVQALIDERNALRAELKLEREWRERAERDLAKAHEELGRLRHQPTRAATRLAE